MPNQRDPKKKMLAAWVDGGELALFKGAARAAGMSLTEWVINALEREIDGKAKPPPRRAASKDGPPKSGRGR